MALFDDGEAAHFYSNPAAHFTPDSSFRDWLETHNAGASFNEGSANFNILRVQSHREVERLLLLASSHYRRAHDSLNSVSSAWALVTIYYGSFFAASSLLGMLGAWKMRRGLLLQVANATPGHQRLEVHRYRSTYTGSHQQFWEFYFQNSASLIASASSAERFSLLPVSSDITWLISKRNEINYDSYAAHDLALAHRRTFASGTFPSSLPGVLNTQFRFLESLMVTCNRVSKAVGINSDALLGLSAEPTRSRRVKQLVLTEKAPLLGNKIKRKIVTG